MEAINILFLIAVILMTAAAVVKYSFDVYVSVKYPEAFQKAAERERTALSKGSAAKTGLSLFNKKAYYIALAVIVMIGIGLRVWKFGAVPGGFNQDGAMAAVDGKALADYGTDRFGTRLPAHLYAWGYGQMSSLMSYLIAVFVKIFGLNTITARLPQLIVSIAGGVFFYLFIRDIFGKRAGLIAAAFVAINPWHMVQSRWALDCNLLPHFFMGGLYFLNLGLSRKRKMLYVSMIFFALCMYCYGITVYTIPVFLLAVSIYYLIKKRLTLRETVICAGIYLLIAWPFLLTMAVNFFKWDTIELPFVTIQYFSGSVRASDILLFSDTPFQQLGANIRSLLNTTVLQKKDLAWNDIENFGTMFLCSMPFAVGGIVELFRKKTNGAKALVFFALFTGVWAGLLTNNVNVNRVNIIYYGIMMFIVLGIDFAAEEIRYTKWAGIAIYAVLGVMLTATYFGPYADMIKGQFYYGFGESLEAAEASGAEKIYVTADAQFAGYWNVSEILTLFYDRTDAEYFQGLKNVNNGQELLPYRERFTYVSMSGSVVEDSLDEDAAYVILNSDRELFDTEQYEVIQYGGFCAVTKKQRQ